VDHKLKGKEKAWAGLVVGAIPEPGLTVPTLRVDFLSFLVAKTKKAARSAG
jgi:hypothetical protein